MSDSPSRCPTPRMKEDRWYYSHLIDKALEIAKEVKYCAYCLTVLSWAGSSLTLLLHLWDPCTPRLTACFGRQRTDRRDQKRTHIFRCFCRCICRCLGVCKLETKGNEEVRAFRVLKNWGGRKETGGVSGSVVTKFIRVRKRKGVGGQLIGWYQGSSEAAEAKLKPHSPRGSMCSVCPKKPLMALGHKREKKQDKICHLKALSDRWAEWTKEGALDEKVNSPVQYARYHPVQKTCALDPPIWEAGRTPGHGEMMKGRAYHGQPWARQPSLYLWHQIRQLLISEWTKTN